MPILNGASIKSDNQIWQSPDGSRKISEVIVEYQGKQVKAKTYSDKLVAGWSGDIEAYEKEGRNGTEIFVKQAPREDGGYRGGGGARQPKDEKAIQAMWAIGQSIQAHIGAADMDVARLESVEGYAKELNAMVDRVKTGEAAPEKPDEVITSVEEPLDLSLMDEMLGGKPTQDETPWGKV